jgi:uncharacterized membrane protein YczE
MMLTFGISLTIKADLGAGPWDALNVGLASSFGLTIGSWVIIVGLVLIVINAFLLNARPDVLAVFTIALVGFLIDFWLLAVLGDWYYFQFRMKVFILLVGLFSIGLGVAIYLQADFSPNPIDNFMIAIKYRFHVSFMMAKTVAEIVALVLAFVVGGPVGIGTFVIGFCIGPFIHFFHPYFERLFSRIVR